ncbi:MAG: hypothetical protein IPM71_15550 [Bacteroidota bacterium]|nr:MAG: hypothetical protein IPM71_15550 [Bacteroidota bacterium]
MKTILQLTLISIIFFGCGDDNKEESVISYQNINVSINSINYTFELYLMCYYASPEDSSASILVDIDNDNNIDLELSVSHHMEYVLPSRCEDIIETCFIKSISSSYSIAKLNVNCVKTFNQNESINNNNVWETEAIINDSFQYCSNNDTIIIGIRNIEADKINYGWLRCRFDRYRHQLVIFDCAYNLTNNNEIFAGQIN